MGARELTKAQFLVQLRDISALLNELELLKDWVYFPKYSCYKVADYKDLSYTEVWDELYKKRMYDFLLIDDSFIQFKVLEDKLDVVSFSYYDCPYIPKPTIDDYINENIRIYGDTIDIYDVQRDYELITKLPKDTITPLRYDLDHNSYVQGRHPASHMHFGNNNNIRVCTLKILQPISFMLFVIRQCYPKQWDLLKTKKSAKYICRNIRDNLDQIHDSYYNEEDRWEMILTS